MEEIKRVFNKYIICITPTSPKPSKLSLHQTYNFITYKEKHIRGLESSIQFNKDTIGIMNQENYTIIKSDFVVGSSEYNKYQNVLKENRACIPKLEQDIETYTDRIRTLKRDIEVIQIRIHNNLPVYDNEFGGYPFKERNGIDI